MLFILPVNIPGYYPLGTIDGPDGLVIALSVLAAIGFAAGVVLLVVGRRDRRARAAERVRNAARLDASFVASVAARQAWNGALAPHVESRAESLAAERAWTAP